MDPYETVLSELEPGSPEYLAIKRAQADEQAEWEDFCADVHRKGLPYQDEVLPLIEGAFRAGFSSGYVAAYGKTP